MYEDRCGQNVWQGSVHIMIKSSFNVDLYGLYKWELIWDIIIGTRLACQLAHAISLYSVIKWEIKVFKWSHHNSVDTHIP